MIHADTNVLIDILSGNEWAARSTAALRQFAPQSVGLGPVVYAELAVGVPDREKLDAALRTMHLVRLSISDAALFRAGREFAAYRQRGGPRTTILPDFLIGAHAALEGGVLLTRDARRYRAAFPELELIEP